MSKKDRREGWDSDHLEAARVAGLAAAAVVNMGRAMTPEEILRQAEIYEAYIVDGLVHPS